MLIIVLLHPLLGRRAPLFADSELLGVLHASLRLLPRGQVGLGFPLVSPGLPLGRSSAAGLLSICGLAILGDFDGGGFVFLELSVLLGELSILLASRDAHVLVGGGTGLAAVESGVQFGRSSSSEGD